MSPNIDYAIHIVALIIVPIIAASLSLLTLHHVQILHVQINSRMDALLKSAEVLAYNKGHADGRDAGVLDDKKVSIP